MNTAYAPAIRTGNGNGHPGDSFFQITRLRIWFPVLPFIVYWVSAFLLYHFGPLSLPLLSPGTYLYLAVSFFGFVFCYRLAVGRVPQTNGMGAQRLAEEHQTTKLLMYIFLTLGFIGCAGFVVDRLYSGAGSVAKTLTETQFVRTESVAGTTWVTTVSVAPYSFLLAGLALYFYFSALRAPMNVLAHLTAWGSMGLLCFNAFLSVHRGNFFWVLTYIVFYYLFVKGERLRTLLWNKRYFFQRLLVSAFIVITVVYVFFIAVMRHEERGLKTAADRWIQHSRFDIERFEIGKRELGAALQLVYYGTHQLEFTDAFLQHSHALAFYPEMLAGGRILDQINKFDPFYVPPSREIAMMWIEDAGLPRSAWPSVFGWLLVMFGFVGAPIFMMLLGLICGWMTRRFLVHFDPGSLIICLCLYGALNMSFNWIGGDFPHNMGYLVGAIMIATGHAARSAISARGPQWRPAAPARA